MAELFWLGLFFSWLVGARGEGGGKALNLLRIGHRSFFSRLFGFFTGSIGHSCSRRVCEELRASTWTVAWVPSCLYGFEFWIWLISHGRCGSISGPLDRGIRSIASL